MGFVNRIRSENNTPVSTDPLQSEDSLGVIETKARELIERLVDHYHGRLIHPTDRIKIQSRLEKFISGALPPTIQSVEGIQSENTSSNSGHNEQRVKGRSPKEVRERLENFCKINSALGLITREELTNAYGLALLAWAGERLEANYQGSVGITLSPHKIGYDRELETFLQANSIRREQLIDRVLEEGMRWEDFIADCQKRYSPVRAKALGAAGIFLGPDASPIDPLSVEDVLCRIAHLRLIDLMADELSDQIDKHNQLLHSKPLLEPIERDQTPEVDHEVTQGI